MLPAGKVNAAVRNPMSTDPPDTEKVRGDPGPGEGTKAAVCFWSCRIQTLQSCSHPGIPHSLHTHTVHALLNTERSPHCHLLLHTAGLCAGSGCRVSPAEEPMKKLKR